VRPAASAAGTSGDLVQAGGCIGDAIGSDLERSGAIALPAWHGARPRR
jgi:hypothetical protein